MENDHIISNEINTLTPICFTHCGSLGIGDILTDDRERLVKVEMKCFPGLWALSHENYSKACRKRHRDASNY